MHSGLPLVVSRYVEEFRLPYLNLESCIRDDASLLAV